MLRNVVQIFKLRVFAFHRSPHDQAGNCRDLNHKPNICNVPQQGSATAGAFFIESYVGHNQKYGLSNTLHVDLLGRVGHFIFLFITPAMKKESCEHHLRQNGYVTLHKRIVCTKNTRKMMVEWDQKDHLTLPNRHVVKLLSFAFCIRGRHGRWAGPYTLSIKCLIRLSHKPDFMLHSFSEWLILIFPPRLRRSNMPKSRQTRRSLCGRKLCCPGCAPFARYGRRRRAEKWHHFRPEVYSHTSHGVCFPEFS